MVKIAIGTLNGSIIREATAEEQAEIDAQLVKDNQEIKDNYLNEIKKIRLEKQKTAKHAKYLKAKQDNEQKRKDYIKAAIERVKNKK